MKLEIPAERKLVHVMSMPIRWGDMDLLGHVNNTLYFRYLESARVAWFETLVGGFERRGQHFVIANAFCNFIRQLEYPGDLVVKTFISNVGRSSLDTWATMERADQPGIIHANAGATAVWIDRVAGRSAPFPDWLREKLEAPASGIA